MTDVLISYARRDRGIAARLAACLSERGLKAVWDVSELPEGALMDGARRRVAQAPAVVVLWSDASLESPWVCDEANAAFARNAHIAAALGGVQSPSPAQASIDLSEWRQTGAQEGLDALIAAIADTSSRSRPPISEPALPVGDVQPPRATEEIQSSGGGFGPAIGFLLLWLFFIGVAVSRHNERAPVPLPANLPGVDMDATEPLEAPVIIPTPEEENAPSGLRRDPPLNQDSTGSVKK